jgi:hypothetical protein
MVRCGLSSLRCIGCEQSRSPAATFQNSRISEPSTDLGKCSAAPPRNPEMQRKLLPIQSWSVPGIKYSNPMTASKSQPPKFGKRSDKNWHNFEGQDRTTFRLDLAICHSDRRGRGIPCYKLVNSQNPKHPPEFILPKRRPLRCLRRGDRLQPMAMRPKFPLPQQEGKRQAEEA